MCDEKRPGAIAILFGTAKRLPRFFCCEHAQPGDEGSSEPYTNNVSERNLRPSVVFRKVTNGFRCEWGAETYAAFRSVVSTAKANGTAVLEAVRSALLTTPLPQPLPIPG